MFTEVGLLLVTNFSPTPSSGTSPLALTTQQRESAAGEAGTQNALSREGPHMLISATGYAKKLSA